MSNIPGWQNLIVCQGTANDPCTFNHIILLVKVLINNLVIISTLLAVIVMVYAGFLLITSGGNPGAKDRAKKMLGKVVTGYIVVLAAWLIVYTITNTLLDPGYTLLGAPR